MTVKKLINQNEKLINQNEKFIREWEKFIKNGYFDKEIIKENIGESWRRSKAYGIDPYTKDFTIKIDENELKKRWKDSSILLKTTKPFMSSLYKIVKNTDFIIRLTDKDGFVLGHIGEEKTANMYFPLGLEDGYNIKEEVMGTTAIGMVLLTGEPIQVM